MGQKTQGSRVASWIGIVPAQKQHYGLVGNVVDMSMTFRQQAQMSENSKKDTSVVDMFFIHAQVTCRRPVVVTNCD